MVAPLKGCREGSPGEGDNMVQKLQVQGLSPVSLWARRDCSGGRATPGTLRQERVCQLWGQQTSIP